MVAEEFIIEHPGLNEGQVEEGIFPKGQEASVVLLYPPTNRDVRFNEPGDEVPAYMVEIPTDGTEVKVFEGTTHPTPKGQEGIMGNQVRPDASETAGRIRGTFIPLDNDAKPQTVDLRNGTLTISGPNGSVSLRYGRQG